jgi:hypothetical protein
MIETKLLECASDTRNGEAAQGGRTGSDWMGTRAPGSSGFSASGAPRLVAAGCTFFSFFTLFLGLAPFAEEQPISAGAVLQCSRAIGVDARFGFLGLKNSSSY